MVGTHQAAASCSPGGCPAPRLLGAASAVDTQGQGGAPPQGGELVSDPVPPELKFLFETTYM